MHPKSVLQIETPHKVLYGWYSDLSHPKITEAGTYTRHVVEARNVVLVETPRLIPQLERLSLQQGI